MKTIQVDLFLEISGKEQITPIDVGLIPKMELNHSQEFVLDLKLVFPETIIVFGKTYNVFNNLYYSPSLIWRGNEGEYKTYLSLKRCFGFLNSDNSIEISLIE